LGVRRPEGRRHQTRGARLQRSSPVPGGVAAEQQEEVIVQAAEVDLQPLQQRRPDHLAGIPEVRHPLVDHPGAVDLAVGVGRPPLHPDHVDPQPDVRVALQDVGGFQGRPLPNVVDLEGVAGQLHHPEQARRLDAAVVVVHLHR